MTTAHSRLGRRNLGTQPHLTGAVAACYYILRREGAVCDTLRDTSPQHCTRHGARTASGDSPGPGQRNPMHGSLARSGEGHDSSVADASVGEILAIGPQ
ncbi:hypothetical protein NDU88_000684 [Pleurodeles waltl]|uniref:Uncharacterized protein n=1 Tax=Pleurodeles waltl TaxID=8319 RepID=A0AAV7NC29_PLEWA|nr:hypothetical protein NDU88_000684 [Pleurodeles waltl]